MDYDRNWLDIVGSRLLEIGEKRLAEMDASGIDVAILSLTVPRNSGHPRSRRGNLSRTRCE
jgi:hypothetical protein